MNGLPDWSRSTWTDAGHLAALIDPHGEPGEAAGQSLPAWHMHLIASGKLHQAADFLSLALPRYECVVWAARSLLDIGAVQRDDPLMVAVLRWIDDPDDAKRREVGEAADAMRKTTPVQLLGEALFLSGGSLAPADLPAVLPPPDVCAKLASAAVQVGAQDAPDPLAALRKALALGEAMVTGQ